MSIRTTVTLDDDVLEQTRQFSQARKISFREALSQLVRAGLRAEKLESQPRTLRVKPFNMGSRPGINYDNIEGLLELLEGDLHR